MQVYISYIRLHYQYSFVQPNSIHTTIHLNYHNPRTTLSRSKSLGPLARHLVMLLPVGQVLLGYGAHQGVVGVTVGQ